MRHIAQKSIGNLHETSDTTMLQISNILNNLEHGLFSINLDGPINDDGKIALLFESHLSTSKFKRGIRQRFGNGNYKTMY